MSFPAGTEVDETAIRDSLIDFDTSSDGLLDLPLGEGLFHRGDYFPDCCALSGTGHETGPVENKTRAAKLLGLNSYQTLSNWLERYGVEEDF